MTNNNQSLVGPKLTPLLPRTIGLVYQVSQCAPLSMTIRMKIMGFPAFFTVVILVTQAQVTYCNMATANISLSTDNPTYVTTADEVTAETTVTRPASTIRTKPEAANRKRKDEAWPRLNDRHSPQPGSCLYFSEPLRCFAKLESRGLNWLRLAAEYNSSFNTDFPDTCRYTSDAFRCTVPLSGHLATILRTLAYYRMGYRVKITDRGPYGMHLDIITGITDIVNLLDLFSTETALSFERNIWDHEEAIYEEIQREVEDLPKINYERRDLRRSFYAFFARVCNQLDFHDPSYDLLPVFPLEKRRPLTSLDARMNTAYRRSVNTAGQRALADDARRSVERRTRGKRSFADTKVSTGARTKDTGHIYTEPLSETDYVEPESLLPVRGPPPIPVKDRPSRNDAASMIPTAQEAKPARDFFTRLLSGKKQLGVV